MSHSLELTLKADGTEQTDTRDVSKRGGQDKGIRHNTINPIAGNMHKVSNLYFHRKNAEEGPHYGSVNELPRQE